MGIMGITVIVGVATFTVVFAVSAFVPVIVYFTYIHTTLSPTWHSQTAPPHTFSTPP